MKNKKILFTLLLLTVILSINLVSATDIDNNQTTDTITQESIMQETNEIQNDISADTKEITKKTDDTIKEASPTQVDVNNYNELVTQVNKIQQGTQKEYTINLKPGNYNATANMTLKQKNGINYNVKINGNNITLYGQNKYSFMKIENCSIELNNIILKNFYSNDGTIFIKQGNLTLTKTSLINNSAINGGAVYLSNSKSNTINSSFINNTAGTYGGAIYSYYSENKISNSILINNKLTEKYTVKGGAIYSKYSNDTIVDSLFDNNSVTEMEGGLGCAIYYEQSIFKIVTSNFTNNSGRSGGGIYARNYVNGTIINSSFKNNKVKNSGGAIAVYAESNKYNNASVTIINSSFINNSASNGGSISLSNHGISSIINSSFINNTANKFAGAIYAYGVNSTVINSTLTNNTAQKGGAIYLSSNSNCTIINSTLTKNTAQKGGAIYYDNSTLKISDSTLKNNTAKDENDIYNSGKTTISLTKIGNKNYRDNITIAGNMKCDIDFNSRLDMYLLVNDYKINLKTDYNGNFSTNVILNSTGKCTIMAVFEGNNKYLPSNATTTFNVAKRDTTIKTEIDSAFINVPVIIKGNLTDKNNTKLKNANIYFKINNQQYHTLTDNNGQFSLNYTPTKQGRHNITIFYKGNKNYNGSKLTTSFEVENGTNIQIHSTYYRENITIHALLMIKNKILKNTNVNLTINDETKTIKTDSNGQINYTCISKKAGDNKLKITYNDKTWTQNFITLKRNTTIINSKITETSQGNISISGKLVDSNGTKLKNANIYITINGKNNHILTDKNGIYRYNYTTLYKKSDISIKYNGNTNYEATNITATYNLVEDFIITPYNNYVIIEGQLTKGNKIFNNTYVNVTINNETTKKRTDNNGILHYTYYPKKAGNTTLEVTYKNIKWIQNFITPKINSSISISNLMETNDGNVNINGQLISINYQIISNAKVYITVNGKTKHAITDNNGTYQSTYTSPNNGTYTVTVEFRGNNDFLASTNNTTIQNPKSTTINVNNYNDLIKEINNIQKGIHKEYTINLKPGNYNATGNMALKSNYGVNYKVIINGNNIALDGKNKYQFMYVEDTTLELRNITLKNYGKIGYEIHEPAIGVYNGNITVINSSLIENKGSAIGLGHSSKCNVVNSILSKNVANYGGAIRTEWAYHLYKSKINIINSTLSNNRATGEGFEGMYFSGLGGAIYGSCNIINSILINNTADYGGAIYAIYGPCNITDSKLINNKAIYYLTYGDNLSEGHEGQGGAIFIADSCNIVDSQFSNNTGYSGGAIYSHQSKYSIINSEFTNNNVANKGGAIYNYRSILYDSNSIFRSNQAKEGNDIYNENSTYIAAKATKITVQPISQTKADEKTTITGKLTDENNNPIKNTNIEITINGKLYGDSQYTNITKITTKTNDKGIYNYTYTPNSGGNYTITVNFPGDQNYKTNKTETTLNVNPIATKVTVNPITNAKVNQKISITGKLTDENNKPLRLTSVGIIIDNNKIYVKTDENGIYSYAYTPTSVGTKNIKIYYGGYHKYAYSLTTLSLNVKA